MSHLNPAETRQCIVETVGNSVYHALGLKESLEEERRALEQQDMTALHTAIESKGQCVSALRQLETERLQLCSNAGFPSGPGQMQQMTEWCDKDSIITNCWQHLMEIAVECNALNMTNGAIIRGRKQQIETSLSIIRGGVPGSDTYSRGGGATYVPSQQSLAEA